MPVSVGHRRRYRLPPTVCRIGIVYIGIQRIHSYPKRTTAAAAAAAEDLSRLSDSLSSGEGHREVEPLPQRKPGSLFVQVSRSVCLPLLRMCRLNREDWCREREREKRNMHLPGAITTTAQKRPISWSERRRELSRSAKSNIESRRKRALEAECRASRRSTRPFRQTIDAEGESNMQARRTSSTSKTPACRE